MERFDVKLEDIYFDGYCQYKECYGGVEMQVYDSESGDELASVSDEECFMFSGYKQHVWMSDLDEVVSDLIGQVNTATELSDDESEELKHQIQSKLKAAVIERTIAEWYSEPDYVSGWDNIEVAEMA